MLMPIVTVWRGANYTELPVNKPRCPVHSPYARDGVMRGDGNYGGAVNYEPNSFGGPVEDPSVKEPPLKNFRRCGSLRSSARQRRTTPRRAIFFRLMSVDQKEPADSEHCERHENGAQRNPRNGKFATFTRRILLTGRAWPRGWVLPIPESA